MRIPILIAAGAFLAVSIYLPFQSRAINDSTQVDQATDQQTSSVELEGNKLVTKTTGRLPEPEFVPGEVIVKFKSSANVADLIDEHKSSKGVLQFPASVNLTNLFERFAVDEATTPFAFAKASALKDVVKLAAASLKHDREKTRELVLELRAQPEVEYAELNLIMRTQAVPNDPYYSSSGAWGQDFRDLWGLQKINAESAWNSSTGSNIIVAVSDTGVDYNHEDIAGNIWQNPGETGTDSQGHDKKTNGLDDDGNGFVDDWHGWDFVTIDSTPPDNDPMDDFGHGTHVAGTIAAVGNNGKGIIGVAYGARIMPVKGLDANGSGSTDDLVKTILYAADNGAKVINASWGGFASEPVQTLIDAIAYAHDAKGVVFVAAAGNNAFDVGTQERGFFPANIRNVITVSAFDHSDAIAYFSNFGQKIDVAAPGGGDTDPTNTIPYPYYSVLSLLSSQASSSISQSGTLVVGGKYLRIAGTSMAAPHVAGVAALIRSLHPEFSPEQVRQALHLGGDDVSTPGFDTNSGYGRINAPKALTISDPLVAQLTGPVTTLTDTCNVELRGTAAGAGFSNWRLEFGAGTNPTAWTQIASSTTQVTNGVLANWNTTTLADGSYTVHLIAQNTANQVFEDRLVVSFDSVLITEPIARSVYDDTAFRSGTPIVIKGTAAGCAFSGYTVRVKRSSDGQFLSNPAISLTNGGLQRVSNNVLATWDTTNVPQDRYQIILEVLQSNGSTVQKSTKVIIDPSLHPGWPKNLNLIGSGVASLALTDHLNAADVDGDGDKDLVIGYGNEVHIFDHTGNALPGWPKPIGPENYIQKSPAVGDLDGDGSPEVVAAATGPNGVVKIFIWHADGSPLPGWPKVMGNYNTSITIDDINGDHVNEIIAVDYFRVRVFDQEGQFLPGWPMQLVFTSSSGLSPACIADLDLDGRKELVVKDLLNGYLHVLRFDGTALPGWPKQVSTNFSWVYPAIGDLDGNGRLEIVLPSSDGKVYAFVSDGSNVTGWPQMTDATVLNSAAIGDIDGDGKAEVVVGGQNLQSQVTDYIYAWHGNGTLFPNWPVTNEESIGHIFFGFGAPVLADVDGDGRADVVASSDSGFYTPLLGPSALKAFKYDGSKITGFPKQTIGIGAFSGNTVAVADLDHDGLLEMAWIDSITNLYVWDLQSPASTTLPWPMFHHDAQHTGANPLSVGPIVPSSGCPSISGLSTLVASPGDTITINGSGFSGTTSVKFSNNLSATFNVFGDTRITAVVPAGAVNGPITLSKVGCTDLQTPSLTVCSSPAATLSIDSGTANTAWSFGSNAYYVNRLTPSSYPAKLSQVSIYFAPWQNLAIGTPITVVVATNPSGSANIDNLAFQTIQSTVGALNQFNAYSIPNPPTITSGDFVIGFTTAGGTNVFPGATSNNATAGRSYGSGNGVNFFNFQFSNNGLGNFMIRGLVFTGNCGPPTPTPGVLLSDDFNDNIGPPAETTKWVIGFFDSPNTLSPTVEETSQQLRITPVANIGGVLNSGYFSTNAYNFTESTATVEVVQTTNNSGQAATYFYVGMDGNNWVRFVKSNDGMLYMQERIAGAINGAIIPYSATTHRWWRIRHILASDRIAFETSPDNSVWTAQHSLARPFAITAIKINLAAGTYSAAATPGTAIFDNFVLATAAAPTPTPTFAIDDVTHNEGDAGTTSYTFTVTKTGSTALSSSVDFTTVDGTATTANNDYQANSGTLTFLPADTTKTITVLVSGDTTFEPDEAFTVHLSGASGATISDADGTGTITNDDSPSISGHLNYQDTASPASNITMTLTGNNGFGTRTTVTDGTGDYTFANVPTGNNYTVTPSRAAEVHDPSITAFDASRAARFAAFLITLTTNQQTAGDVTNNGAVTAFDASQIARYAASIPTPASIAGSWKFAPGSLSINNLSGNQTNQNLTAILVGDITGNWTPSAAMELGRSSPSGSPPIVVSLPIKHDPPGGPSTIPINVGDTTGQLIGAYIFDISFDPAVLELQATPFDATGTLTPAGGSWSISTDTTTPGHLKLNANGTSDLTGQGVLLNLKFNVIGGAGTTSPLTWVNFIFDEGDPADSDIDGFFTATGPTAANGAISGHVSTGGGAAVEGVVVRLNGAHTRATITDANGNYNFDNVETNGFCTVTPARVNYTFSPSQRSFSQLGEHTEAAFTAAANGSGLNPLDTTEYFVRQQYVDFLNQEPDEAGFNFWVNNIQSCGTDAQCVEFKRIQTSAAFFLSIEYQETGYLVYRLYQSAYGTIPGAPVPIKLNEFKPDTQQISQGIVVNQGNWQQQLETNKQNFTAQFVQRSRFTTAFPTSMTPAQFVDKLNTNAGNPLSQSQRDQLVNDLSTNARTRAQVLRAVAEHHNLVNAEFNPAFVLAQYFGYLRRNPNDTPDSDYTGYDFWLGKLNQFNGNFVNAEMVKAFIVSREYQQRFGP